MDSTRPRRERKKRTIWEELPAHSVHPSQISKKKARRTVENEALKPVAAEPIPISKILDENLPIYHPPLKIDYKNGRLVARDPTELIIFKNLISDDVVDRIITATNSYTERHREFDEITVYSRK